MRWSSLLLVLLGCASEKPSDAEETSLDVSDADTDTDTDTDTDADVDTDADTGTPGATGLSPGFEGGLTVLGSCVGNFVATNDARTIGLYFEANDLVGDAYKAGADTVTPIDLAVEGWRLEVHTGTGLDQATLCGQGSGTITQTWAPVSGSATVSVWPHQTQPENSEGELELQDVLLRAPGAADMLLSSFLYPRSQIGGISGP